MMNSEQIISVVEAHENGAKIQAYSHVGELGHERGWVDVTPNWDFYRNDFRVKPQPKEFWICEQSPHQQILTYRPINPGYMHVREVIE